MEKINNKGKELFNKIYNSVERRGFEETIDILTGKICEKVYEKYIKGKSNELYKETIKICFDRIEKQNQVVFENMYNKIYLKLLGLYSKITKNNKEDETLYYVMSKFAISPAISKDISKAISDLRKIDSDEDILKVIESTYKQMDIKNTILKPCYEAEKYADSQYRKLKNLEETNMVISTIVNYDYFESLLERLDSDYFRENIFQKITIKDLALAYCDKYGFEFTEEEKVMLQKELSQKETEYVSNSIKSHSH